MDEEEWFVVVYAGMCTIPEAISWVKAPHDKHFKALVCLIDRYRCTLSDEDIDAIIQHLPGAMIARCSEEVVSQLVPHVSTLYWYYNVLRIRARLTPTPLHTSLPSIRTLSTVMSSK